MIEWIIIYVAVGLVSSIIHTAHCNDDECPLLPAGFLLFWPIIIIAGLFTYVCISYNHLILKFGEWIKK